MDSEQAKLNVAIVIALEAEVLIPCDYHSGIVMENGIPDVADAYKLANSKFTAGKLGNVFSDRRDMTVCIKTVFEEALSDCPFCDKLLSEG